MLRILIQLLAAVMIVAPPVVFAEDILESMARDVAKSALTEIEKKMIKDYVGAEYKRSAKELKKGFQNSSKERGVGRGAAGGREHGEKKAKERYEELAKKAQKDRANIVKEEAQARARAEQELATNRAEQSTPTLPEKLERATVRTATVAAQVESTNFELPQPTIPASYERIGVDDDVVVLDPETGLIADIVHDPDGAAQARKLAAVTTSSEPWWKFW